MKKMFTAMIAAVLFGGTLSIAVLVPKSSAEVKEWKPDPAVEAYFAKKKEQQVQPRSAEEPAKANRGFFDRLAKKISSLNHPEGGDPLADRWEEVNSRWVRNHYANGAVTLSDKRTGLMWIYDASFSKEIKASSVRRSCTKLTYAGYSDWSIPTLDQMMVIYEEQGVFKNIRKIYWTSTPTQGTWHAIYMKDGYVTDQISDINGMAYMRNVCSILPCRSFR